MKDKYVVIGHLGFVCGLREFGQVSPVSIKDAKKIKKLFANVNKKAKICKLVEVK